MARQHRIQYPGAWYHVTHRGAGRQDIYRNNIDRRVFLKQLAETKERYSIEIHAFCLMTNHYHLLVRTPEANLSTAMRHLNSTYSQRFNRAHQTDGPVFKGRYAAQLVGEDDYLLSVLRYIHLNPFDAGLEDELGAYRWSSLPAYFKLNPPPSWLEMEWVHSRFKSITSFERFMHGGLGAPKNLPDIDLSSLVIGSERFRQDALEAEAACRETRASLKSAIRRPVFGAVLEAVMTETGCGQAELMTPRPGCRSTARLVALGLASELTDLSRSDLAVLFGYKNHLGVATALQKASHLHKHDQEFRSLSAKAAGLAMSRTDRTRRLSTDSGT